MVRRGARIDWIMFDAELARDGSVDPVDKALYAAIASFADTETPEVDPDAIQGDVPTRKRLAECIGRSVDTVDRATKRLEARRLLRVHRQADPDNPRRMLPSEYELLPAGSYQGGPPVPLPRRSNTGAGISPTRRHLVLERDGYACVACGATADLTIDHIRHQSRGGGNEASNLRILCRPCNSRRRDGKLAGVDR